MDIFRRGRHTTQAAGMEGAELIHVIAHALSGLLFLHTALKFDMHALLSA